MVTKEYLMHTAFITTKSIGSDSEFPRYVKDGWVEKNGRRAYVLQKAAEDVWPNCGFWHQLNPGVPSSTEKRWQVLHSIIPEIDHLVIFPGVPNDWVWSTPDSREIRAVLQQIEMILNHGRINLTIIGWDMELKAQRPYLDKQGIREFSTVEIRSEADKMQGLLRSYLDEGDIHYRRPVVGTCCPDWMCIG